MIYVENRRYYYYYHRHYRHRRRHRHYTMSQIRNKNTLPVYLVYRIATVEKAMTLENNSSALAVVCKATAKFQTMLEHKIHFCLTEVLPHVFDCY